MWVDIILTKNNLAWLFVNSLYIASLLRHGTGDFSLNPKCVYRCYFIDNFIIEKHTISI